MVLMRILKTAQGKQSERNENNECGGIASLQAQSIRDRSGSGAGVERKQEEGAILRRAEGKGRRRAAKDQAYKGTG